MLSTLAILTAALSPPVGTPQHTLMPVPASVAFAEGRLALDSSFSATIVRFRDRRLEAGVTRALVRLEQRVGGTPVEAGDAELVVEVAGPGQEVQTPEEDESYRLEVTSTQAHLTANTVVGALRGLETLLQLIATDQRGFYLPAVSITDAPRFPWRGLLVDACRHWQPVEVIKRTLDGMAAVKLNVLHWHLSEDQGFRVESRRYPKLHELGSDGQYYTQQQIRDVVAYARDRGIRVVPEFDMPGHATAWFVGYPALASAAGPYTIERKFGVFDPSFDPTREKVYQFIEEFIGEMAPLFPDPYWHIGGDEVTGRQWNANILIQKFMRVHRLKNNEALQAHFNQRLEQILERHGKRMVGWDEILNPGLPTNIVVQSWRGTEYLSQSARSGYAGILSAPYYLDHMRSAEEHYLADPLPPDIEPTSEEARRILGGEACMWGEQISAETIDSRIWPRLGAIAERFWSRATVRDVDDMYRRLRLLSVELEGLGLTHESHTIGMLRQLTGGQNSEPLEELLHYAEPVTFGERYRIQKTTQTTPLTGLVDFARPDPWARAELIRLAKQAVTDPRGPAADSLRKVFASWQSLPERYSAPGELPLARDGDAAVATLGRLGAMGEWALDQLVKPTQEDWGADVDQFLFAAGKPQGMLRVVGVEAVRVLVAGR
jgi:hexosaminidase